MLKNKSKLAILWTMVQMNNCINNFIKFSEKFDILKLSISKIKKYKNNGINKIKFKFKNNAVNNNIAK